MLWEQLWTVWFAKDPMVLVIFHLTRSASCRRNARSASLGHFNCPQKSVIRIYRLLLNHYFITQTLHQVTIKGSSHSRLLREAREVEPGMLVPSHAVLLTFLSLCVNMSVWWTRRWILLWRWNFQTLKVDVPGVFFSSCIHLFSSTPKDPLSWYLCSSVVILHLLILSLPTEEWF